MSDRKEGLELFSAKSKVVEFIPVNRHRSGGRAEGPSWQRQKPKVLDLEHHRACRRQKVLVESNAAMRVEQVEGLRAKGKCGSDASTGERIRVG